MTDADERDDDKEYTVGAYMEAFYERGKEKRDPLYITEDGPTNEQKEAMKRGWR